MVADYQKRINGAVRRLAGSVKNDDNLYASFFHLRHVLELLKPETVVNTARGFVRKIIEGMRLYDFLNNVGLIICRIFDGVHALDYTARRLMMVVKIFTTSFVRDFILHRFLHAKEELIIKSRICFELEIESKLK
jgi:hypothetical protein